MLKQVLFFIGGLSLSLAGPAGAEVRNFGPFSLDVPPGWQTNYEDGCLVMVKPAPKSQLIVCRLPLKGRPFEEAVRELALVFKSRPVRDGLGDYAFEFKDQDLDLTGRAFVTQEGGSLKMLAIAGENPEMAKIVDSLVDK